MPFTRAPADSVRITSNKTEQKVQRLQPHKVWIGECKRDFCNSGQDALIGAEAERLEYSPLVLKVPVEMRGFLFTLCSPPPAVNAYPIVFSYTVAGTGWFSGSHCDYGNNLYLFMHLPTEY